MADGPVLRSKPLGGIDRPPQSESEMLAAVWDSPVSHSQTVFRKCASQR